MAQVEQLVAEVAHLGYIEGSVLVKFLVYV